MKYSVISREYAFQPLLLIAVFCVLTFGAPFLFLGRIPGDYGDPLFNLYVLEHVYQWATGKVSGGLFSPPMFYPYPNTLFFSDTHLGSEFFYGVFRAIGFSQFQAFRAWFLIGYFLTLFATYWVLWSIGFSTLASAVGAIIFSFSLPSLAQLTHPQLAYRLCIPLCLYYAWQIFRGDALRNALLVMIWLSIQILISIYLGIFLAIQLLAFVVIYFLITMLTDGTFPTLYVNFGNWRKYTVLGVLDLSLLTCTIGLLLGYHYTAVEYNLTRGWDEIATMLPRPASYFVMDYLPYWRDLQNSLFGSFPEIPMRHEHNLFMGLGPLMLFIIGVFSLSKMAPPIRQFSLAILWSLLAILLTITLFEGFSIYRELAQVPGISSLRAVSRFIVALMFQVAVICAVGVDYLQQCRSSKWKHIVLIVIVGWTLLEIASMELDTSPTEPIEERVNSLVKTAEAASRGMEKPILQLADFDDRPPLYLNLEAMLAAQQLGWPSVSGYSGFSVGAGDELSCARAIDQFYTFADWGSSKGINTKVRPEDLLSRTIRVGKLHCPRASVTMGPSPTEKIASNIVLSPISLSYGDAHHVVMTIRLKNNSTERVSAWSPNPVRLSWRFQQQGSSEPNTWPTRLGLGGDLLPKSDIFVPIVAELPTQPGTYDVSVSLVSENKFWFHDNGMKVLIIRDALKITDNGDVSLRSLK